MSLNNIDLFTIANEYSRYLYLKKSGMFSGKYGDRDGQRRLQKIRSDLKLIGREMKDLLILCMDDIKKFTGK